jgi:hypothetical protein
MSLSLNSIEDIKVESKFDLEAQLTSALKKMAATAEWPEHIISALSINVDDDLQMVIQYPEGLSTEVDDLEYGSADTGRPNSVIRPFTSEANKIITKYLLDVVFPKMIQRAGIF